MFIPTYLIEQKEYLKDVLLPLASKLKKETSVTLVNSPGLLYLINYAEFKRVAIVKKDSREFILIPNTTQKYHRTLRNVVLMTFLIQNRN